jgi:hypothetical protein
MMPPPGVTPIPHEVFAWHDPHGDLVVPRNVWLPAVCLRCGCVGDVGRRFEKLVAVPPTAHIMTGGHLVALHHSQLAYLHLPTCRACGRAATLARAFAAIAVWLPAAVLFVAAVTVGVMFESQLLAIPFALLAALYASGSSFVARTWWTRPRTIWARHIDWRTVSLCNVHPSAIRAAIEAAAVFHAGRHPFREAA